MNTEHGNDYTPTEEDLTAYALGESDDVQTRMIEEALASQPETRALLDEIKQTIALSEATFAELKSEELSREQRAKIESAAETVVAGKFPKKRRTWLVEGLAVAAGIAIIAGIVLPNVGSYIGKAQPDAELALVEETTRLRYQPDIDPAGGSYHDQIIARDDLGLDEIRVPLDVKRKRLDEKVSKLQQVIEADPVSGDADSAREQITRIEHVRNEIDSLQSAGGRGRQNGQNPSSTPALVEAESLGRVDNHPAVTPPPPVAPKPTEVARRVAVTPQPTVTDVELQVTSQSAPQERVSQDRFSVAGQPVNDAIGVEFNYEPRPRIQPVQPVTPGTEAYERIVENQFKRAADAPLSTFSIDVDTASYANVRRFLNQAQLPPADAVRVEELINYFDYDYPQPTGEDPFSANIEVAQAPWNAQHKLVRVGLKGKDIAVEERPATNLVFLLDVSGSMNNANKLPLLKQSLRLLTEQLTENDRVAIAVYAGSSGLVLNSTPGNMHSTIVDSLNRLQAGGSTNGGAGIQLAYDVATQNFIEDGVNRVILATDGDFNVGTTSRDALVNLIENKAKSGVFLSVLGFGMGNLKDATMEKLADKGNGNYAYIDTFSEAKKVLADEMSGTLFTIAKDVKIQVEFNPTKVQAYRLIGYENRALANRDFNDDTKDAGEIGAGHTVTALYEIVPQGVELNTVPGVDTLRYQTPAPEAQSTADIESVDPRVARELLTVKLRYKQPDGHVSKLLTFPVQDVDRGYNAASTDFKFATAVASFGMKLRRSPFAANMTYDTVLSIAESGKGHDLNGYRSEFLGLVRQARSLSGQATQRFYDSTLE